MNYTAEELINSLNIFRKAITAKGQTTMKERALKLPIKRELVKDINEAAMYLYEYYHSIANSPAHNLLDDEKVGKAVGWSARKVRDYREKLTKAGWILFIHKRNRGTANLVFILGKDKVAEYTTGLSNSDN